MKTQDVLGTKTKDEMKMQDILKNKTKTENNLRTKDGFKVRHETLAKHLRVGQPFVSAGGSHAGVCASYVVDEYLAPIGIVGYVGSDGKTHVLDAGLPVFAEYSYDRQNQSQLEKCKKSALELADVLKGRCKGVTTLTTDMLNHNNVIIMHGYAEANSVNGALDLYDLIKNKTKETK